MLARTDSMSSRPFQPSSPRRRGSSDLGFRAALAGLLMLLIAAPAFARDPVPATPLPAWEQLTPTQREQLIAPVRERWNSADATNRHRMLNHARRWQTLTPDERKRAHRGMRRWEHMSPEHRDQMRVLFEKMRTLPPEQRATLKQQWRAMTPEQRKVWLQQNAPQK